MSCDKQHKTPLVVATGICSNTFQWATPLACDDDERVDLCSFALTNRQVSLSVLQRVSGHWRVESNGVSLMFNPCGEVHDLSLPDSCRGALACSKQHNQWRLITRPLTDSLLTNSAQVTGTDNDGFKVAYPSENNCRVDIEYICGDKIGAPVAAEAFQADSCQFHLKWETRAACPGAMAKVALSGHAFLDPIRFIS